MTYAIKVKDLYKKFSLDYEDDKTIFSRVKNFLIRKNSSLSFFSLKNINFKLSEGEVLGVVGPNGAGKTTLLRIIAGILKPTKGTVLTNGNVLSMIELGSDVNLDLTGKENIFLSARILGLKKNLIRSKYPEIVKFSGLGKFINVKTKFYSNGMKLRLAFSIILLANPDIILIDEVFGVGDESFRLKCLKKLEEYRKQNKTIVFVSHDISFLRNFCDKCLYLNKGVIESFGNPKKATEKYAELFGKRDVDKINIRTGSKDIEIVSFRTLDKFKSSTSTFKEGEDIIFEIAYKMNKPVKNPVFGVGVFSSDGLWITGPNTNTSNNVLRNPKREGVVRLVVPSNPFIPGEYFVTVSAFDYDEKNLFDRQERKYSFKITQGTAKGLYGVVSIPHKWEYE